MLLYTALYYTGSEEAQSFLKMSLERISHSKSTNATQVSLFEKEDGWKVLV